MFDPSIKFNSPKYSNNSIDTSQSNLIRSGSLDVINNLVIDKKIFNDFDEDNEFEEFEESRISLPIPELIDSNLTNKIMSKSIDFFGKDKGNYLKKTENANDFEEIYLRRSFNSKLGIENSNNISHKSLNENVKKRADCLNDFLKIQMIGKKYANSQIKEELEKTINETVVLNASQKFDEPKSSDEFIAPVVDCIDRGMKNGDIIKENGQEFNEEERNEFIDQFKNEFKKYYEDNIFIFNPFLFKLEDKQENAENIDKKTGIGNINNRLNNKDEQITELKTYKIKTYDLIDFAVNEKETKLIFREIEQACKKAEEKKIENLEKEVKLKRKIIDKKNHQVEDINDEIQINSLMLDVLMGKIKQDIFQFKYFLSSM